MSDERLYDSKYKQYYLMIEGKKWYIYEPLSGTPFLCETPIVKALRSKGNRKKDDDKEIIGDKAWYPTVRLRWHRVKFVVDNFIDITKETKVLQQMWINDKGEQDWRDVPIED